MCPLIGFIDENKAHEIMEKTLQESKNKQFHYLIFDLSGVHYIDTYVTSYLIKIINSLKMMGVKVIITGLNPATAISIVNLGIDLTSLSIKSNLQQALESVGLKTIETKQSINKSRASRSSAFLLT